MPIEQVACAQCGKPLMRQTWNPAKKRNILHSFCDNACKAAWQVAQRESATVSAEWLREQYETMGRSANDIAREVGRDAKSVWNWLKAAGIAIRPRGTDYGQAFKPGQESAFKGRKHKPETRRRLREIAIEDGRVPYLRGGDHWLHSLNDNESHPAWRGGITPERQALYSTEAWARCVNFVWQRDQATCQICGKQHMGGKRSAMHVHHIRPFAWEPGRTDVGNLLLLCSKCHMRLHRGLIPHAKHMLKDTQ